MAWPVCVAYVAACCLPAPTRWWMRAVWRSWNTCSKWGMPTRPTSGYDNEEIPDSMPLQNQGAIPVLVRLVDGEHGEHYRPAEARRWTETHVMVGLYRTDPDTGRRKDQLAWLRAEDVYRVLRPEDLKRH
jgi:hypothetical protein